eukprot:gene1952-biopygen14781
MLKNNPFDQATYADLRLVLRSSHGGTSSDLASGDPPAKRRCTGLPLDDVLSFFTHKVILASNSPVINAMLLRGKELRDLQAMGDGISCCLTPVESTGSISLLVSPPTLQQADLGPEAIELPMEHDELLACEVLLRSLYSGNLAEEVKSALSSEQGSGVSRVTLLVQVYRMADRLEVCTDQCAQAISALRSADFEPVDDANYVFSLKRAAPALVQHATIKVLMETCLSNLVEHFNKTKKSIQGADFIKDFKRLDFLAVLAFLNSHKLVVGSENEVLTLMGMWMGEDWADRISKEQLVAFWKILRLGYLTTSFISNLSVVAPWLPVDPVVLGQAAAWKTYQLKSPNSAASMQLRLQSAHGISAGWFRHRFLAPKGIIFTFSFSEEELAKLRASVQHAGAQEDLHTIRSGRTCKFNGYDFCATFSVQLLSEGSKPQFVLSFGFEFAVSEFLSKGARTMAHVKASWLDYDQLEGLNCLSNVDDVLDGSHAWEWSVYDMEEFDECLRTLTFQQMKPEMTLAIDALD